MICRRFNFKHVPYKIDIIKDKIVSKCTCFIDKDTELVKAHQILNDIKDKDNSYETCIKILEENGVMSDREDLENMFVLAYLMLNEDRHLNNFGIIRNVENLNWVEVAPIFDTVQSLNILDYN